MPSLSEMAFFERKSEEMGIYLKKIHLNDSLPPKSYLRDIPAVRWLEDHELDVGGDVIFFTGENGSGKSTLLEAIAVSAGFNPEGGTRNFSFSTNNTHSELSSFLAVGKKKIPVNGYFLRAESFYNAASYIGEIYSGEFASGKPTPYGQSSLHEQSHGESFMSLVRNRFTGNGLYILDEPESALSPARQLTLLGEMKNLVKDNSQFIIATHSPILTAYPGAKIFEFSSLGIRQIFWKESENYIVTKEFLNNPDKFLDILF